MELYEGNYVLVRLLVPDLRSLQADETIHVSAVEGCLDLELSCIKHEKYTTTFNLTYRFVSDDRNPREPDLTIRIYHDARTCEVMSGLLQGLRHGPLRKRDLDTGHQLNRFLYKWLSYCLRQGHSFRDGRFDTYQNDFAVAFDSNDNKPLEKDGSDDTGIDNDVQVSNPVI